MTPSPRKGKGASLTASPSPPAKGGKPDEALPDPYGSGPKLNEWKVDRDGTLIEAAGHVHPGGLWTDLDVLRGGRRVHVFRSDAHYFDPNGPVSWDMAMTKSPLSWRVGLRKGDVLRVSATYDTTRASWYESMGLMLLYMADDKSGADPFAHPVHLSPSLPLTLAAARRAAAIISSRGGGGSYAPWSSTCW